MFDVRRQYVNSNYPMHVTGSLLCAHSRRGSCTSVTPLQFQEIHLYVNCDVGLQCVKYNFVLTKSTH